MVPCMVPWIQPWLSEPGALLGHRQRGHRCIGPTTQGHEESVSGQALQSKDSVDSVESGIPNAGEA